jgi:Tyrosine-protein kinase ephrin type A/B receptor-like
MYYISVTVCCDLRDDVVFAIGRSMSLHISSLWVFLLTVMWPPPCRGGLIDITVTIMDTDGVSAWMLSENYTLSLQYDDTLLDVQMCSAGTFSDDHSGVCRPCTPCTGDTFARGVCEPWSDTYCAPCRSCVKNEKEICSCGIVTNQCYLGDRACLPVAAVTMHLNITLVSAKTLTAKQVTFVQSGLQAGYIEWLQLTYLEDSVTFDGMYQVTALTYTALFTIANVYNEATVASINSATQSDLQRGILYTFSGGQLRRRSLLSVGNTGRRLLATSLVDVGAVTASCTPPAPDACGPFRQPVQHANCSSECLNLPCPVGYSGHFGDCTVCAPNAYKDTVGNATCTACPVQHTSPAGSTSVLNCSAVTTTTTASVQTSSSAAPTTSSTVGMGLDTVSITSQRMSLTTSSTVKVTTSTTAKLTTSTTVSFFVSSTAVATVPVGTPSPPVPPPPSDGGSNGATNINIHDSGNVYDNHVETHQNNMSIQFVDAHQVFDTHTNYDYHRVEHNERVSYSILPGGSLWMIVLVIWGLFPLYVCLKVNLRQHHSIHRQGYQPVTQWEDQVFLRPLRRSH